MYVLSIGYVSFVKIDPHIRFLNERFYSFEQGKILYYMNVHSLGDVLFVKIYPPFRFLNKRFYLFE